MKNKKDYLLKSSPKNKHSGKSTRIVGIGASAGGLEALEAFFGSVPKESPFAFVVILHLSPDYKSLMGQLLSKHTHMQIHTAKNGITVETNNVYLIPPKMTMTIKNQKLFLHERQQEKIPSYTIDIFFKSLAEDEGEHAIGIILSGTGSDGIRGLKAIKEVGGMLMVQEPHSAKFDGMPLNAITTGLVDYILTPTKMPNELLHFINHDANINIPLKLETDIGDHLQNILRTIKKTTQVDFNFYKRDTIIRRIHRRMNINKFTDLFKYSEFLLHNEQETRILQKELLIGVTKFFRDESVYSYMETNIIPEVFNHSQRNQIRVWSVACSTGEEAYSLAILLHEHSERMEHDFDIKIFASDIDPDAINKASIGRYPESIVDDLSPQRLNKYFVKQGDEYQVIRTLRDMIIFTVHDINKDAPFNKLNLISCRNLLIYFQTALQRKTFQILNFALNEKGILLLGTSESADNMKALFTPVSSKHKIYRSIRTTKLLNIKDYNLPKLQSIPSAPPNPFFGSISSRYTKSDELRELEVVTKILCKEHSTLTILIDQQNNFIRYFGNAKKFLFLPERLDNVNILSMMNNDLSIPLSTALKRAFETMESVQYNGISFDKSQDIEQQEKVNLIDLNIIPYKMPNQYMTYAVISISESQLDRKQHEDIKIYNIDNNARMRIYDLEQELKSTRENLQATIEELQTSNEELIAANEELQSTNEELQSVNEELYTINSEHQANILELTELNDDVNNLLQSTEIGTLFLDSKLRIRKFNNSIQEQVNITESDIGRPINHFATNLIYPDLQKDVEAVLDKLIPFQKEVQSNNEEWFLMRILPYRTSENHIKGVVITFVNINEMKEAQQLKKMTTQLSDEIEQRKQVEEEIIQQNESLTLLFEALPDLYLRMDGIGTILNFKEGSLAPFVPDADILNKNISAILPNHTITLVMDTIKEVIGKKVPLQLDIEIPNQEKNNIFETRFLPTSNGEVVAVMRDITKDRDIQKKVISQGKELQLFFDSLPDLYFRLSHDGIFKDVRIGHSFTPYKDKKPSDIIGKKIHKVLPEDIAQMILDASLVTLESKEPGILFFQMNKKGEPRDHECRIIPSDNQEITAVVRDVTDIREKERELTILAKNLEVQKQQLTTSNKALEQFAYITSHDLKEPIRSISSFSQILYKKHREIFETDEDAMECFNFIANSTNRMYDLVEGILSYAKLGQNTYRVKPTHVQFAIDNAVSNLTEKIKESNAQIIIGEMPEKIIGNSSLLTRVFQNLISNSIKFAQKGQSPIIKINAIDEVDRFVFTIEDNGKGFNMNYKDLIFEMFKQLNSEDKFRGTGIGLAICKRIIEQLNGEMWVKSEPFVGTTFFFGLNKVS